MIKFIRKYVTTQTLILGIIAIYLLLSIRSENIKQNQMDQQATVLDSSNSSNSDSVSTTKEVELAPTITPTTIPTPTIDPDPIVTCTFPKDCNSAVETIKSSECSRKVCCQVKLAKFEIISSKDECTRIVTEEIKRMEEEYKKTNEDATKKRREDADRDFASYQQSISNSKNTSSEEYQARLKQISEQQEAWRIENLNICRENARNRYRQPPIGSMTNNNGAFGQIVGESQELRNALNKALQQCNVLYGSL